MREKASPKNKAKLSPARQAATAKRLSNRAAFIVRVIKAFGILSALIRVAIQLAKIFA